ncbi:MAG: HEAT repeat domain-containing protein [Fibrobacterota bacterium]
MAAPSALAKLRITTVTNIPTSDLLANKQYSLKLNANFFSYNPNGDTTKSSWWYLPVVVADLGVANRVEVGAGYAGGPTLRFKALIFEEDQFFPMPSVLIGAKDILSSEECQFFGMTDKDTMAAMANNAYLALGKNFEPLGTRFHGGIMTNFGIKSERVSFFVGAEMYLGGGTYLTYEGFRRFGSIRHMFTINLKFFNRMVAGFGFTELKPLLYRNKTFGFHIKPDGNSSGFGQGGVHFQFNYTGEFSGSAEGLKGVEDEILQLRKDVQDLKLKDRELEVKQEQNQNHVKELDEDLALSTSRASTKTKQDHRIVIAEQLNVISELLQNKDAYDPEQIAAHVAKIVEYKELALPTLTNIIRNPKSDPKLTSLAIQMVGQIGDKKSKTVLVRLLDYKESNIKIDAIIALGKFNDKSVVPDLERMLTDTDEAVVMAAQEVIYALTGNKIQGRVRDKYRPGAKTAYKPSDKKPASADSAKGSVDSTAAPADSAKGGTSVTPADSANKGGMKPMPILNKPRPMPAPQSTGGIKRITPIVQPSQPAEDTTSEEAPPAIE